MSLQDVEVLTKAQALCLFVNMTSTIITGLLILFSGHWSIHNIINGLFQTTLSPTLGIPGWIIGMALLITPYFGFETVPQIVPQIFTTYGQLWRFSGKKGFSVLSIFA